MMGILKRKYSELDDSPCYSSSSSPASSVPSPSSSEWDSDRESPDFTPHHPTSPPASPPRSILKRPKLRHVQGSVCFDQVTVYSFPRCQGFTSVPSRGGATLGMSSRHSEVQTFSIAEHALEQRHRRREQLQQRRRQEKFQEIKQRLIACGTIDQEEAERLTIDQVPIEEASIHINSAELESGGFLQPYSSKQRQAILLAAGVKRIDKEEKRQLHTLRLSREICGCDCQGFCEPESCACSLAGIKCQVDRFNFPCGCRQDGCGNTQGRFEFDSRRVRTHYIHTIMRLGLERRLKHEPQSPKKQNNVHVEEPSSMNCASLNLPEKSCPFGFSFDEEDSDLPLTIPNMTSFISIPEQAADEDSCCSDMTVSSSTSSGICLAGSPTHSEDDQGLSRNLNICDNNLRHAKEPSTQTDNTSTDFVGPLCSNDTFIDIVSLSPQSECLDENQIDDNSLEDFPNTPSPSMDYYMDLSLSSDSDLEFFDCDYTSGLPHSSFKSHRHSGNLDHLRLFSCDSLPQYESSTYLLESLIGLTD